MHRLGCGRGSSACGRRRCARSAGHGRDRRAAGAGRTAGGGGAGPGRGGSGGAVRPGGGPGAGSRRHHGGDRAGRCAGDRGRRPARSRRAGRASRWPRPSSTWSGAGGRLDCHLDGRPLRAGGAVLTVTGPARSLLTAERTALNLIGQLSGIATLTRQWVDAVAGTGAAIRDTRKTTPGLRALEKYAVRCGGGVNHRMALGDAALVKDNHVAAAGGIRPAVEAVRGARAGDRAEVECDTLDQVREASRSASSWCCSTTSRSRTPGRRCARARHRAPARGQRRAHPRPGRARWRRPASTTSPSARSPTAPRCWTSASTYATDVSGRMIGEEAPGQASRRTKKPPKAQRGEDPPRREQAQPSGCELQVPAHRTAIANWVPR